mgnify:CR=1 FL=1
MLAGMIALPLAAAPAARPALPNRLRRALPALLWGCRWFGLGLLLGALTDLAVRIAA